MLIALACGVTLAVANFLKLMIFDSVGINIAFVVSAALAGTVLLAKVIGSSLPILAQKLGFDPTVMASPIITTIVDAVSLVIYFQIATSVLNI